MAKSLPSSSGSLASRTLRGLAHAIFRAPHYFFYPQILLAAAAVFYTVRNLDFSTSRGDLVGSDKKYHANFQRFKEEFNVQDDLVAVVESEDFEKNRQFVERLGARMEKESELFSGIHYKGDLKMMGPKALLFVPEESLAELNETLRRFRPFIEEFTRATNLNELFRKVNQEFREARRQQATNAAALVEALPALTRVIEQAEASLDRPGIPPSPGMTALFNAGNQAEQEQYITFADGRIYLVSARPLNEELASEAVARLRELVQETQSEVPGVNVGITGETVLELDEMNQARLDSTRASVGALALVALIFIFGYQETGRPIKATLSLVIGICYTLAYTTFAVGRLNILTVTFLPILIGLAIDFGIHLITRFEEELSLGKSPQDAMEKAIVNTGLGIFTGCFTTSGAFFAMALTDFKGIQEMGIITGGGILICLLPMITFLPVCLLRGKPRRRAHKKGGALHRARIEKLWLDRPGLVMSGTLLLCGLASSQFGKLYFDYNLLNMQSEGLPAVIFERKLIDGASKSVLFGAVVADSLEEGARLEERILELPSVAGVDSMSRYLWEDQTSKLEKIRQITAELEGLDFMEDLWGPANAAELSQTLFYTRAYLAWAIQEVKQRGEADLQKQFEALRAAISSFRQRLADGELDARSERDKDRLGAFQRALFTDIRETFASLKDQDGRAPLTIEDLPKSLRERFVGATGKHLLQVYPKENVWEREHQEKFIQQLRTVDPEATGTPVQLYEYTNLLRRSYEKAALYALAAISLLVLLHFKDLRLMLMALLPVAVGSTWMLGIMSVFGVPFNPANIMTLPLVVGIGVTNGIHILNRFVEEKHASILSKSTGKAVLISGLTTIAGFASLIPAKHQGIASLGLVMTLGVTMCMLAALAFLPSLMHWTGFLWIKRKRPSDDDALSTLGQEEPR